MARPRTLDPRHALAPIAAALMCVACGPPPGTVDRGGAPAAKTSTVDATAPPRPPLVSPGPRLSRDVAPTAYGLVLDVDPDQSIFQGEVTIDVAIAVATDQLWLNAVFLEIDDAVIEIGGVRETLAVTARDGVIGLDLGRPMRGAARVTLRYRGWASPTDPVGLFTQTTDGASYLFSQLESMYARRVLPCFDEPGWKVPWQVTLVVPPGLIAASNTPEVARATRADGKVAIRFATTPPMPSYLLAIAVGPFDVVEVGPLGRARVPARVLVAAGRGADAAVAVAETPRIVDALEAYLDRPLPLAKLDSVAVPSFPGAMENPGLIMYSSALLLASPQRTADDLWRGYRAVAAHELAHQWFGDLITMTWWNDLWLHESFATWLAAKVVAQLDPAADALTERRRARAAMMSRDRMAGASAIRRTVTTLEEAEAAFDPLAYGKGAAVLTMFEHWIGPERFRDAIRGLIDRHAGGSFTTADVAAAIGAGDPEVGASLISFLDQPGLPRIELALDCTGAPAAVATISAAGPSAAPWAWPVPLCVRFSDSAHDGAGVDRCGWLAGAGGRLELGAVACPAWLVGDAGATGYFEVGYQPDLAARNQAHLILRALDAPLVTRRLIVEALRALTTP